MKKIKEMGLKTPLIIIGLVLFFSFSTFLVKKVGAETYNQSILKDFLQVITSGSFGGGVVTGLDNPDYGLVVASGKVGIGTTTSDLLMTVAGDMAVTGELRVNGSLDCPIFYNSVSTYGHKSWPGDTTMARFSGLVPSYGIIVNESGSGNDERLVWYNCRKGGQGNPLPNISNVIGFTLPGIELGDVSTIFTAGDKSVVNPIFRYATGKNIGAYNDVVVGIYNDAVSKAAFCEELGLELDSSTSPSGVSAGPLNRCVRFNTTTGVWNYVSSCSFKSGPINCKI